MSEATSTIQFEACLPDFHNSPWLFKAFPIFFLELGSEYLLIFEKMLRVTQFGNGPSSLASAGGQASSVFCDWKIVWSAWCKVQDKKHEWLP